MSGRHAAGKGSAATPPAEAGTRVEERRGGSRAKPPERSSWLMWGAGVVVFLVVALGLVTLVRSVMGGGTPEALPSPTSTGFDRQRTLLVQLRDSQKLALDNSIVATGGGLGGAQIMSPSRLLVDVAGAGQMPLAESVRVLGASASQDALSDLLALKIDGSLTMERLAFAGLVDAVGGIEANIAEDVFTTEKDGTQKVVVTAGTTKLDGVTAADYALATVEGEPEEVRLARWSEVLNKAIKALPDDPVKVQQIVTSLGATARTTVGAGELTEFLLQARKDLVADNQEARVLPTTPLDVGGDSLLVRADLGMANQMLSTLMPQAQIASAEARTRVLVQNGVGTPGLGAVARDRLVDADFVYVNGGNAATFNTKTSAVIVPDGTSESAALGAKVAKALKLPETSVVSAAAGQSVADVVVVLGADFPVK